MNNRVSIFPGGALRGMARVGGALALVFALTLHVAPGALAADPPAKRADPNGVKLPKPSGLTGDLRA